MNVLQEKYKLNNHVMNLLKYIHFKNSKIKLSGTASLQAMKYFSDYDFITKIKRNFKSKTIKDEFKRIITDSRIDDVYFIELKIQYDNGKKKKIYDISDLKTSLFKNIDFVKIDYIIRYRNIFKELSIIYSFNDKKFSKEDRIKQLNEEYNELTKQGNYYKALKRKFSIYKIKRNYPKLVMMTNFFNSNGDIYEIINNLKTIQLLLKTYDDDNTKRKVIINLKDINVSQNDIDKTITKLENDLNNLAKNYIV